MEIGIVFSLHPIAGEASELSVKLNQSGKISEEAVFFTT